MYLAALDGNEGQALCFNTEKQLRYPLCKGALWGLQVFGLVIENKRFYPFLKVNPNIFAVIF